MSSERVGTAALVKSKDPLADYFHCTMHSFNLSASQSSKIVEIRHCFDCIQEAPSPDPCPIGEGDTPPRTPPRRRLRCLDTRAFGARHVPPFENPGSAPDQLLSCFFFINSLTVSFPDS